MVRQTLENRVEKLEHLEKRMSALDELPARVANLESQILQFRDEVRVEFSAVRSEMRDMGEQLRGEMNTAIGGAIGGSEGRLRVDMHSLNERVLSQMRMLHEDVIDRIKLLAKG